MNKITAPPLSLEFYEPLFAFDIERHLQSHPYDPARLQPVYDIIDDEIRNFNPMPKTQDPNLSPDERIILGYGAYMADEHLPWTSSKLAGFLSYLGYNEDVTRKVEQAFKRHDAGKILQPDSWKITAGKQQFTPEEKKEKARHGILGIIVRQNAVLKSGMIPTENEMAGFEVADYLSKFHHERLNGTGPLRRTNLDMCPILRAAAIVDTFHGKLKAGTSPDHILDEMAGKKHDGEFDIDLIDNFRKFLPKPQAAFKPAPQFQP